MLRINKFAGAAVALALCALAGCSSANTSETSSKIYSMGERAQAGTLIYTITEAEWLDRLGDEPNVRVPEHKFLAIRMSVTNSGVAPSAIPVLNLTDSRGQRYPEQTNGEGLTEWLGFLRQVKPANTERGRVLFDVPVAAYRLRVVNDAEPENERAALVDIPLHLGPAVPQPELK
jgi:hypothetical protein